MVPDVVAAVRQAEEQLARSLAARATERPTGAAPASARCARLEGLPVTQTLHDRTEPSLLN